MLICLKFLCLFMYVICSNGFTKKGEGSARKIGGATFSRSKFFGVLKKVISKKIYYFKGIAF